MAATVKHAKTSLIPDTGDSSLVLPSDWNANHVLTGVQGTITLTTTGTSGPATLVADTLNIPQYADGAGTVTTVSVVSANGLAGSVANPTTTPALTLSTTITGVLKGNGTAISAATVGTDYSVGTSALATGILKSTTGTGALSIATAGTDYEVPLTFSTGLTRTTNTITVNTSQNIATLSNLTTNGLVTTSGGVGTLGVTAPGTGVLTALGVNVGTAGAFVVNGGALGTPSSGTATNLTGTASGLTAGNVTTNANLTGVITSVGNATSIASQTGTGTKFVVDTGPTISALTATGTTTATGLVDISGASAGQIKFPATQNPSANANTLDDYEEGSWTPTMSFGGSSTGVTYTTQVGSYWKTGALVFITGTITLSNNGSGVGNALIGGLPFTQQATFFSSIMINYWANASSVVSPIMGNVQSSGTTINLVMGGAASAAPVTDSIITNTTQIQFSGCYIAS